MIGLACGRRENTSAFSALLREPPYLEWTKQIEKDESIDSLYLKRGQLLLKNGHTAAARADFEKAWSLNPGPLLAQYLATTLESPQEQCVFLKKAVARFPNDFPLEYTLAEAFETIDSTDAAIQLTEKWFQAGVEIPEFILLHAGLLKKKGKNNEAVTLLETLYENEPDFRPVMEILALHYAEAGDQKVLAICRVLSEADSTGVDPLPAYYSGIFYATTKKITEAIRSFDQAIQIDYNFVDAYIEKAALLHEQQNHRGALMVLGKALAIAPNDASVYYWTAKCQQAMGDKESARLNYLKAYGLDKTFEAAKQAADQLK